MAPATKTTKNSNIEIRTQSTAPRRSIYDASYAPLGKVPPSLRGRSGKTVTKIADRPVASETAKDRKLGMWGSMLG